MAENEISKGGYFLSAREWLEKLLPIADIQLPAQDILDNVLISPSRLIRDPVYGAITETRVMVRSRFDLKMPGLTWVYPSVGGTDQPIRLAYSLHPQVNGEIGPFPVSIHIDHPMLEPMRRIMLGESLIGFEPDTEQDNLHLTIEKSYLSWHHETGLGFGSEFAVSIPPFRVAGSDLILAADYASLILREDAVDQRLLSLGMSNAFRGLYATEAVLYWLPQIQLLGFSMPGIRLDFEHIAIGNEGVSFSVLQSFGVTLTDEGEFNSQQTEMLGVLTLGELLPEETNTGQSPAWLVNLHQGLGFGETAWQLAIAEIGGSVRNNLPEGFRVKAYLRLPFFDAIFSADLRLSYHVESGQPHYRTGLKIRKESETATTIRYLNDGLVLQLRQMELEGELGHDHFRVEGLASFTINLFGLNLDIDQAGLLYEHENGADRFRFALQNVVLGQLGSAESATLELKARRGESGWEFETLNLTGIYQWQSLAALIPTEIRDTVDLPDDGRIEAHLQWHWQTGGPGQSPGLTIRLLTGVSQLDRFWHFIPFAYRPQVERLETLLKLHYASADTFNQATSTGSVGNGTGSETETETESNETESTETESTQDQFSVELSALMQLRLPFFNASGIPGFEFITLQSGDETGLIEAELKASYSSELEQGEAFRSGLTMNNPFALALAFPGTDAATPFIHTALTRVGLQFELADDSDADNPSGSAMAELGAEDEPEIGGRLLAEGSFQIRPMLPQSMPFAGALNDLTAGFGLQDLQGNVRTALSFTADTFDLDIQGQFEDAGIDLDVFRLLSTLAGSSGGPESEAVEVDFDIRFSLIGFRFQIGYGPESETASADNDFYFNTELKLACKMTGLPEVGAAIRLSDDAFSLALENLDIPLELPRYPINNDDLARLRGDGGRWTPAMSAALAQQLSGDIAAMEAEMASGDLTEAQQFRLHKDKLHLELKRLFLQLIMAMHQRVAESGRPVFEGLVEADTWVHATALQLLHFETSLKLHFPEIRLHIPFQDPTGIALEGRGQITGFADKDPLKGLESVTLGLGLSTEFIYLRLDSDGSAIEIPDFGTRYSGGSVSLNKLLIGYGYTKNSFALDFAGSLTLPPALIDDADTSDQIGVGIRLPSHAQLAFTIDLIPVTIGKASFIVPVPRFDLDLRHPSAPALVSTARCEPYWDGLQFIARDILRADLKRIAFSPFFGPVIAPNGKFDGDIKLGSDSHGATLIIDDLLVIFGVYATSTYIVQVPIFADPTMPYFQNVCVNLRAAGFQLNFNLQRPFPSFSPMALIEVFGLISDPLMKIDPKGSLANTIRMSLTDAWVQMPDYVLQMFPEARLLADRPVNITFNLGTLISLVQGLVSVGAPVLETLQTLANDANASMATLFQQLAQTDVSQFDPWDWIGLLPPELRKFRVGGQVAGFSGSACLVLATAEEASQGLRHSQGATPLPTLNTVTDDGDSIPFWERHSEPLYEPITGVRFSQYWHSASPDNWEGDSTQIRYIGDAPGSELIYQGDRIPEDVTIDWSVVARLDAVDSEAGIRFCHQENGAGYCLSLQPDPLQTGVLQLSLKRQHGALQTTLLQSPLTRTARHIYRLTITSWVLRGQRHFQVGLRQDDSVASLPPILQAVDADSPLGAGRFGLLAAGNAGVRFRTIRITPIRIRQQKMGRLSESSARQGFNINLPPATETLTGAPTRTLSRDESQILFKGLEFDAFRDGLPALPRERLPHLSDATPGVIMAARLNLYKGQRLRFLGQLFADGSFLLVAEASARPLKLDVFGLIIPLPFKASAALTLAGRQRRQGYYGSIEAKGTIDWSPIPNLIRFQAGSRRRPCVLQLSSDGSFVLEGHGHVDLFAGAARVEGSVLITEQQAAFRGRLKYELGQNLKHYPFVRLLTLDLEGEGEVHSLARFSFLGRGQVQFLGETYSAIEVSVNQDRAAFALSFRKGINTGATQLERDFPILTRTEIQLDGRCEVSLRRTQRPEFRLQGEGYLSVLGASIHGKGEIRSQPRPTQSLKQDGFDAIMEGNLRWQGREWLGGRIEVGSKGLALSGQTRFGLQLTPANISALNLELASLFLEVDMRGEFRLDVNKQQVTFLFRGHWTLGAAMAGTGSGGQRQILPLASSRFSFSSQAGLNPDNEYCKELIHIDGFSFLPIDNITIPLPSIDVGVRDNAPSILRIGKIEDVDVARFRLPDDNYLWMQTNPPYFFRPPGEWEEGSLRLYSPSDYRVTFDAAGNQLPLDFSRFSEFRIELVMDADLNAGFPLRLRITGPDGAKRTVGLT